MNAPSISRRRFAPVLAALGLWISAGSGAFAADVGAPPSPPAADRAKQQAAFQAYTDAWGATSAAARLQRLSDSLATGMTYQDASVRADGAAGVDAMIARFQRQSPGVTLKLDDLLLWADHGLAKWSMMDPKGGLIMHGYDVVAYDPAGHIRSIVGFFDIPGQRTAPAH
ncbi:MAG: hypothetical protein ACXU9B_15540 [Reyranella sp.]